MTETAAAEDEQKMAGRGERFFVNVLWSWAGVGVSLFTGIFLARYIIQKLGADGYGIWSLTFSIIGYYGLFDLGFRSAVVHYSAYHLARGEHGKINELINTTLAYLFGASAFLIAGSMALSRHAPGLFNIAPEFQSDFAWLVLIVGISISLGLTMNVFTGAVEGFQRFNYSSRIQIIVQGIRSGGVALMLALGYGLVAMGLWALCSLLVQYALYFFGFWRLFPALRFSPGLVKRSMLKQTARYGMHTLVASTSAQSIDQTPSLLIARMLGTAELAYFNLPFRLTQYAADAVTRVGLVASPQATEYYAQRRLDMVAKLGIFANRYCFIFYLPLALMLLVYGQEIVRLWINEEFALRSGPLMPILAVGTAITYAGQFSSSAILFGMAKHRALAYGLLTEALMGIAALLLVLPRYGILGGAMALAVMMIAVRGMYVPMLVCRTLKFPFHKYMASIYGRPLAIALAVWALLAWLKAEVWPGDTWLDLMAASLVCGITFLGIAFFLAVEPEHRAIMWRAADRLLGTFRRRSKQ
jgi:O-antigen/teichoic acid export membrane protein